MGRSIVAISAALASPAVLETAVTIGQPPEFPILVKEPVLPCKIHS